MKKIIVVVNQKGGVGKTTSVINIASSLAKRKKRVLVVDLDPQGNATTGSGIDKIGLTHSIYDVLINDQDINSVIVATPQCGFDILPSNRHLAGAEIELVSIEAREYRLKNALSTIQDQYDVIMIDCPPSLSLLTLNALSCADYLLVPIQCEYYALEGLTDLLTTIKRLKASLNSSLELIGLIRTMYDKRNNLATQVSDQLISHFGDKVFKTFVPRNVRLAEAPSYGVSAIMLDSGSLGSQAYLNITSELFERM